MVLRTSAKVVPHSQRTQLWKRRRDRLRDRTAIVGRHVVRVIRIGAAVSDHERSQIARPRALARLIEHLRCQHSILVPQQRADRQLLERRAQRMLEHGAHDLADVYNTALSFGSVTSPGHFARWSRRPTIAIVESVFDPHGLPHPELPAKHGVTRQRQAELVLEPGQPLLELGVFRRAALQRERDPFAGAIALPLQPIDVDRAGIAVVAVRAHRLFDRRVALGEADIRRGPRRTLEAVEHRVDDSGLVGFDRPERRLRHDRPRRASRAEPSFADRHLEVVELDLAEVAGCLQSHAITMIASRRACDFDARSRSRFSS